MAVKGFLSKLCFCQLKSLNRGLLRIYIELNVTFSSWINISGLFDGTSAESNSASQRNISEDLNPQTPSSYTMVFVFMVPCSPLESVRSQINFFKFFSFSLDSATLFAGLYNGIESSFRIFIRV